MIAQRRGKMINISSLGTWSANEGHGAYSTSKAGLNMLTKCMACEWTRHGIQANAVAPTIVMTDMGRKVWSDPAKSDPVKACIPAHRFGEPVEIADLVLYLASPPRILGVAR
jgi:NAD(P)-dependent dehydrogenase (short-subunit alcohol dehydrogenase family)